MLIAFEGLDCAGKTTIVRELSKKLNCNVCEEFSSPIGNELHKLLENDGSFFLKTYYFAADRAWVHENIAQPALKNHELVIWDRYVDSSLAYRYAEIEKANIIDYSFVEQINSPFPQPDLTVFVKITPNESVRRAKESRRKEPYDLEFLKKVAEFYEKRYKNKDKCLVVDGEQQIDIICNQIINEIGKMTKKNIDVDYEKAYDVLSCLEKSYHDKAGLLQDTSNIIENQIPNHVEKGSEEHARFLFFTALNDHGLKSNQMYEKSKDLYNRCPWYFSPEWICANFSLDNIDAIIKEICTTIGARYPQALAKSWYKNAVRLKEQYQGKVLNLFKGTEAISISEDIQKFNGIGSKIGGMIFRAAVGLGWIKKDIKGLDQVLVPVDIHDSRIMFLTGVLSKTEMPFEMINYYEYHEKAQEIITQVCRENKLNWMDVDRALWLVGSTGCAKKMCNKCPLKGFCKTLI